MDESDWYPFNPPNPNVQITTTDNAHFQTTWEGRTVLNAHLKDYKSYSHQAKPTLGFSEISQNLGGKEYPEI